LKLRALTEQTYIDEVEYDEEGLAEMLMDENTIAQVARTYIIVLHQYDILLVII